MSSPGTIELLFLGSGTSAGVPMIGCHCAVCASTDPHDKRNRASVVISYGGPADGTQTRVLVDTTPELRLQCLANDVHRIDADLEFAAGEVHARLELDAEATHPSLGSGLQMRLKLPIEPDAMVAQRLNANERLEPDAHQLGAWCVDDDKGVMFTAFVPAAAHTPGLARALVYHLSARNEWARALLFPAG